MERFDLVDYLLKIEEIVKIGLKYSSDPYAIDNYTQLQDVTNDFINHKLDVKLSTPNFFTRDIYPTPSVSVRTVILSSDKKKVLLVRERCDGGYSLPGGWTELGLSPSASAIKEVKEEAGKKIRIKRLVGVLDRYNNITTTGVPEYIIVFEGEVEQDLKEFCYEITDVNYFDINDLPSWSLKNVPSQMDRIIKACVENKTIFD